MYQFLYIHKLYHAVPITAPVTGRQLFSIDNKKCLQETSIKSRQRVLTDAHLKRS